MHICKRVMAYVEAHAVGMVLDASRTLPSHSPDKLVRVDEVDDCVSKLHVALQLWAGSVLADVVTPAVVTGPRNDVYRTQAHR